MDMCDSDVKEFQHLQQSMTDIGMSRQEKADLFSIVAAVLHLGNLQFEEETHTKKGGSVLSSSSEAKLLAVDREDLRHCLTSRVMTTTKKGTVGTVIK